MSAVETRFDMAAQFLRPAEFDGTHYAALFWHERHSVSGTVSRAIFAEDVGDLAGRSHW